MRRWAVAGAVAVLALGAWFVVRPFMARQRDYPAEIPSPAALVSVDHVPLARGRPVCSAEVVVEPHSQQARFKIAAPAGPAGELRLSLVATDGSRYRYAVLVPPGAVDGQTLAVPVAPPIRPTEVRACIANHGARPIALLASGDRTRSRSLATIRGEPTGKSVWFSFYEATPRSITERLPATLARMTTFRPGYVGRGLLWALLALLALGVPAGLVWALRRAFEEEEAAAPPLDVRLRRPAWRRWLE